MPKRSRPGDVRVLGAVVRTAFRLGWRHWPALLSLACAGVAIRAGVVWSAVHVSDEHHFLGRALLILAPPGFLIPLIGAMYVCRASLPRLAQIAELPGPQMPIERRPERLIDLAASVLLPFLAIYESYGLFEDDVSRFRNATAVAELSKAFNGEQTEIAGRLGLYGVPAAIGIMGAGFVLRAGLGWIERLGSLFVFGYIGALGDVTYTSQVASQYNYVTGIAGSWLQERRAWDWVVGGYDDLQQAAGFLAGPVRVVAEGAIGLADSWEQLVLVPAGWLAVGLVVLGRQELVEEETTAPDHRAAGGPRRSLFVRMARAVVADTRRRIGALWHALTTLGTSGLYPTLGFSLILLVVVRLPSLLYPAAHLVFGPTTTETYLAFSPMVDALVLAVSMAITVPLVAAGVDFLVTTRLDERGLISDLDARTDGEPAAAPSSAEAAAGVSSRADPGLVRG